LLLFWLYSRVLSWLDHYHAARQRGHSHLLRVGAPAWMCALVQHAADQLAVSPRRWPIVREKAARLVVARVLRVRGGERVLQQKLRHGPALELVDDRGVIAIGREPTRGPDAARGTVRRKTRC